jgi:putative nucleotidyltransferase with HDIG domain
VKHEIMKNAELLRRPAVGAAVRDLLRPVSLQRSPDHTKRYIQRYKQWVKQLQEMYSSIKANQAVPFETVHALIAEMIIAYLEDSALFLSLINCRMTPSSDKYVASHCVNVCILATGMAAAMGCSAAQTIEIAWGALFHDIGHTSTFRPLLGKEKLNADEQHQFDQHVITGLSLLKNISSLPRSVGYVAYQHHERINGSGVILHCQGSSIHDFAKLVGVADEFESIAAKKSPCSGMSAIIAQTKAAIFEPAAVKALLLTLSLFPLGSLVQVTNNKVGRVIAVNGEHFKEPVINLICELNQNQLFELPQNEIVDLLKRTDIKIIKDITHPMLSAKIEKGF